MNLIKIWKKRKQKQIHDKKLYDLKEQARLDKIKQDKETSLEVYTARMLKTYCAINKKLCTNSCIHFQKGTVWYDDIFPECKPTWRLRRPNCKLWS